MSTEKSLKLFQTKALQEVIDQAKGSRIMLKGHSIAQIMLQDTIPITKNKDKLWPYRLSIWVQLVMLFWDQATFKRVKCIDQNPKHLTNTKSSSYVKRSETKGCKTRDFKDSCMNSKISKGIFTPQVSKPEFRKIPTWSRKIWDSEKNWRDWTHSKASILFMRSSKSSRKITKDWEEKQSTSWKMEGIE